MFLDGYSSPFNLLLSYGGLRYAFPMSKLIELDEGAYLSVSSQSLVNR